MPLSPGEPWGVVATLSTDTPVARSDRELAELIQASPHATPTVALTSGDLCRTLGGRGDVESRLGHKTTLLPVDVAEVTLDDGDPILFVAHLVARGRLWNGEGLVAMNAERIGEWRLAPRGHPGDGRLDLIVGQLRLRQRLLARSRAKLGEHLPHPDLKSSRITGIEMTFARVRRIYVDDTFVGTHRELRIVLRPTAVNLAV